MHGGIGVGAHQAHKERLARIEKAVKAKEYREMVGINPEPYWPQMWFWDLVDFRPLKPRTPKVSEIIGATAAYFKIAPDEILSGRRIKPLVIPRHVAMYLARQLTLRSFPEIGRFMGGRDHTTVLHACNKIQCMMETHSYIRTAVTTLKREFGHA